MILYIRIDATLHQLDATGERYIRYTPVLKSPCGGEIPGPIVECGLHDGPAAHEKAKHEARRHLCTSLAAFLQSEPPFAWSPRNS